MLLLQIPCDGKSLSFELIFELATSREILTQSTHAPRLRERRRLEREQVSLTQAIPSDQIRSESTLSMGSIEVDE